MSDSLLLRVRAALSAIKDPASGRNIIASGAVRGLAADDSGRIRFTMEIPGAERQAVENLLEGAKQAASAVEGVSAVSAVATAHGPGKTQPARHSQANTASAHENPFGLKAKPRIEAAAETLGGVKAVIAVASGKGGVGKSTVCANLAVALAARGLKVGLLDADVYGPSLPTLFGISGRPKMAGSKIVPFESFGVRLMSIGFLVDPEEAVAWRGPMVMGAVRQLMSDVDWGELDILLIDTPPGTGDTHLSLIQSKKLTGAVIVSTPQEMALADMRRGVKLFRQTETPVIGVVENMAWLETENGDRQYIFGEGGARKAAAALDAPFLESIPLFPDLRQASDEGRPLAAAKDHPSAEIFTALADKISDFVNSAHIAKA
ncbi:Mrp/NBP35 family ATP-binding protein [Hyphococcus sp.]|uniref:Mrp/NBP35 family ATP-binding protein n=1 Tax=Hyphococcus sp. TaxID=2038636 RepID=UPI00207D7E58|nr:MAG: iron-sulfur cluster carrier protein [Marinicaulis sp.]